MKKFKEYYPFWLGLYFAICLVGYGANTGYWSFAIFVAYLMGYFKLTKLH